MAELDQKALEAAWQDLIDKDDRTSSEEYPDMALISKEELAGYMSNASSPQEAAPGAVGVPLQYDELVACLRECEKQLDVIVSDGPQFVDWEQWRDDLHELLKHVLPSGQNETGGEVEALRAERDKARGYALGLASALHHKHYADVESWKALPDLLGLLTQIDNMTSVLVRPAASGGRNAVVEAAGYLREAQDILAEYIVPDSGISDTDCVNRLLGVLDRKDVVLAVRRALKEAPNA